MAIVHRRGVYEDFNPKRMRAGEWAVVTGGDPYTKAPDTGAAADRDYGWGVYMCIAPGHVKRMATTTEMKQEISVAAQEWLAADVLDWVDAARRDVAAATKEANAQATYAKGQGDRVDSALTSLASSKAAVEKLVADESAVRSEVKGYRDQAVSARDSAQSAKTAAETARGAAQTARDQAVSAKGDAASSKAECARIEANVRLLAGEMGDMTPEEALAALGVVALTEAQVQAAWDAA